MLELIIYAWFIVLFTLGFVDAVLCTLGFVDLVMDNYNDKYPTIFGWWLEMLNPVGKIVTFPILLPIFIGSLLIFGFRFLFRRSRILFKILFYQQEMYRYTSDYERGQKMTQAILNKIEKLKNFAKSFINQFRHWRPFEIFLGIMAVVGSVILTILWDDTIFGLSVTLTGILCVVLVSKRSQWNYFWGTYNVIGYAYLAFSWGLGGDFMLNAFYFLPMQLVGFLMWKRNLEKGSNEIVKARDFTKKGYIRLVIGTVLAIIGYSLLLQDMIAPYFNSLPLPVAYPIYSTYWLYLFDSMSTVLSVIAMWLMAKRYAAQWLLWIFVNVASIGMWSIALLMNKEIGGFGPGGAIAMIFMWSMYLINAAYGFYIWRKKSVVTISFGGSFLVED
jgi:nicotinamide mononucleotide transporter